MKGNSYMNKDNNNKFKNLIVDAYNKSKEGNLVGIVYSAASTYGFKDLIDEMDLQRILIPICYTKLTDTEIDIYKWELEDYKIKSSESTIYVKLKNKMEVALMYQAMNV